MRVLITYLSLIILVFLVGCDSATQNTQVYQHPAHKFQFEASKNWVNIQHAEDPIFHEMMSPDSSLHVILWYTETEQSAEKYLVKMAGMKDLTITTEVPSNQTIDDKEIWLLRVPGNEQNVPVRVVLGVTSHGMSEERPKENRLYILQIWCHETLFGQYESEMEQILQSVKIGK
jgi:hypothetical protein